jgi:hypothetical protein
MTNSQYSLGRSQPPDWRHVEKYPFSALNFKNVATVERVLPLPGWHTGHDQLSEGSCFEAGTLISMADGSLLEIEKLRLLDRVLTAEGNVGEVRSLFVREYSGKMYSIKLWGHNAFESTATHPILTKRGYVEAKDIKVGDFIFLTKGLPLAETSVDLSDFINNLRRTSEHKARKNSVRYAGFKNAKPLQITIKNLPDKILLNKHSGRLFGLYLAEGGSSANKVTFTFGSHEKDTLVLECVSLIKNCFGVDARVQVRPNNSINVVIYGKEWRQLFEYFFPGNCWSKDIRGCLMSGNREFIEAMFYGWMSGDGFVSKKRSLHCGVTVSKKLAFLMYRIAQTLGLSPALRGSEPYMNEHARKRAYRWDISFGKAVFKNKDSLGKNTFRCEQSSKGVWRKVRKIDLTDFIGHVFNFEVHGDNSYVANGIGVHNCVGFGCAMMMAIRNKIQKISVKDNSLTRYNPWLLWNEAKIVDQWPETNPGDNQGTSVRAGCQIMKSKGLVNWTVGISNKRLTQGQWRIENGISAYRWAASVDEVRTAIYNKIPCAIGVNWYSAFDTPQQTKWGQWRIRANNLGYVRGGHCVCIYGASDSRAAVKIKNSWGREYPEAWLPYSVMERLIREYGEVAIITDR